MKNCRFFLLTLTCSMLLFAGCETNGTSKRIIERINEKPSVFAALAPDQKAYVRDGIVFPGDSLETAYIALGIPDTVETRQKEDITVVMWTYSKYYPSGELAEFMTAYSRSKIPIWGDFSISKAVQALLATTCLALITILSEKGEAKPMALRLAPTAA